MRCCAWTWGHEQSLVTMRVGSWDIDARDDGLSDRSDRLLSYDADILLLQQVLRRAAPLLSTVSHVAWAKLSALNSEPNGGQVLGWVQRSSLANALN